MLQHDVRYRVMLPVAGVPGITPHAHTTRTHHRTRTGSVLSSSTIWGFGRQPRACRVGFWRSAISWLGLHCRLQCACSQAVRGVRWHVWASTHKQGHP